MPIVNSTALFDHERLESEIANPAAIMSGPNGPGERAVATTPASTYASTTQAIRAAWTPGWST